MQNNHQIKSTGSTTKRIIAITTITTMAAAGLANAQIATPTEAQKSIFEQAMSLFKSGKTDEGKQLLNQNGLKTFGFGGDKTKMKDRMKGGMHEKGMGQMHGNRKAVEDAIISGNYTNFQQVASSSPLAKIDQNTFNLLTPQFQAKKNAEEQIRSILTAAGIKVPTPGERPMK